MRASTTRGLCPATLAVVLTSLAALASAQVPAGGAFVVDANGGASSSVAMDAAGDFVVAWMAQDDGNYSGVSARRYDAVGSPLGPGFRINTYTTGNQGGVPGPRVASDAAGDVVVVWSSSPASLPPQPQDGSEGGVFAQRHDAAGSPRGAEFQVNTFTTATQWLPSVASDAAGNFVVVWSSAGQDGSGSGVFAQRYRASGAPHGLEFRVNDQTTGDQSWPFAASDPAGNFVVVWRDSGAGVAGQMYDSSGAAVGTEFRVTTDSAAEGPVVAMESDGSFVAAWTGLDADTFGIFSRRYDSSGAPLGSPFQVSTTTTGYQTGPSIAVDGTGGFVVAWTNMENTQYPFVSDIRAQRYDATGTPRGTEFQVSGSYIASTGPSIASDTSGNFVVLWQVGLAGLVVGQRFGGLSPAAARVDLQPSSNSDGNGVLEPGESVDVVPFWHNVSGAAQTFGGRALSFSGPPAPNVSYDLLDALAVYGTVPNGTTAPCTDCYAVRVPFGGTRPATHWDATFEERLTPDSLGQTKRWPIHVAESFTDVPKTSAYYRFVETMLHKGVAGGCLAASYCPVEPVTREQMSVFTLVGKEGAGYSPAACTTPLFADVPASSPFCRFIEELSRRGVVGGCGNGNFCPAAAVTRAETAVFVLRTLEPALNPPLCTAPPFADVPVSSPYCPWIKELSRRGIVSGCGGGNYCPALSVSREQMAVFISATFGLALY